MSRSSPPDDIVYPATLPFVAVHFAGLAAIWTGVTGRALAIAAGLYLVRMFAITAGYHRLFSHRSYRTSRLFQFALGFLAQTSAQTGVLWWAAKHREHHKHADTELDPHSPGVRGFLFSHVGWIFHPRAHAADYSYVPDLTRQPELVWLDRNKYLPAILLGAGCFLAAGWPGLVVGFFWSTVATWHATFAINSLAHVHGRQRYVTGDESRNNFWLALITLGEGWHNNHHWFQGSVRQGFRWWEIDLTFYALRLLAWTGLVWDLKSPPAEVVRGERPLPRALVEKAAARLAAVVRTELERRRLSSLSGLKASAARHHLPSLAELRERAESMFATTPSLDEIVERARALLAESFELAEPSPATAG
ncbi:MAG TPA: acyl-CoA desaturase [Thermoanaerobaculia bacterium]|nr:acyl-CoA desaturase [Thermoanaerobaculia bacterium]